MTRSEKIQLTKEIKGVKNYILDLEEMKTKQGDKYFFLFENRKCERWMLHGEWFFNSTIRKEQKYLSELIEKRNNTNN